MDNVGEYVLKKDSLAKSGIDFIKNSIESSHTYQEYFRRTTSLILKQIISLMAN